MLMMIKDLHARVMLSSPFVSFRETFWRSRFQSLSDARLRIAVVGNRKYLRDLVESIIASCVEFFDHRPIDFYFLPECHSVTCTPLRKRPPREHHGPASDKPASGAVTSIRPSCTSA
jgi:hypothetical protein